MDAIALRRMLRAVGMTVGRDGTIKQGAWTFGTMDADTILLVHPQRPTGGDVVIIGNLAKLGYCETEHTLSFEYSDGTETKMKGDYPLMGPSPDQVKVERKMPKALSKLNDVLEELYPAIDDMVYYDELKERDMVDLAMFDREGGAIPLDDATVAIYCDHIERRLDACGFRGTSYPSKEVRMDALTMKAWEHKRNPFREWVESIKWDGQPRVRRWLMDTVGATAPPLEKSGKAEKYLEDVTEAWLLGAIARNFSDEPVKHDIVPVLIGAQGIGKGNALQYTAGHQSWYIETVARIEDEARFRDSIRGRVIVELSESKQIRGGDIETVKGFISKMDDQYRKPYAHYDSTFPRHFIFVACSNMRDVFTDITGNRRFFPMYCNPSKATREFSLDGTVGQNDVEQMWAEALQLYRDGRPWFLDDETKAMADFMQGFASVENSNIDIIDDWLDDPSNGYSKKGSMISKQQLLSEMFGIDRYATIPKEVESAWRAWTNATRQWEKEATTQRVGGKVARCYRRVLEPGQVTVVKRLKFTSKGKASSETKTDPVEYFREYMETNGLEDGSEIDRRELPEPVFNYLFDEGYIYESGFREGEGVFRIITMP